MKPSSEVRVTPDKLRREVNATSAQSRENATKPSSEVRVTPDKLRREGEATPAQTKGGAKKDQRKATEKRKTNEERWGVKSFDERVRETVRETARAASNSTERRTMKASANAAMPKTPRKDTAGP